jgi:hypothetical protein
MVLRRSMVLWRAGAKVLNLLLKEKRPIGAGQGLSGTATLEFHEA